MSDRSLAHRGRRLSASVADDVPSVPIATGVPSVSIVADVSACCRHPPAPHRTSADTEVAVTWG